MVLDQKKMTPPKIERKATVTKESPQGRAHKYKKHK